jgi:2-desacetyl-2-hydroxyethyl bacteriochlorophyllide A dehydrogenase
METRALWHLSTRQSLIREGRTGRPESGECLVQAYYSMISVGTERLVARGGVPPALYAEMAVPYMQGSFAFPLAYGYSLTGVVLDGPREWLGERVHLMHPHQTVCRVRTADLTVIPPAVPLDRAVLASNLETAVNALWDAGPLIGQEVLVVGFGLVGALVAHLLQPIPGIRVHVAEPLPARATLSRQLGHALLDPDEPLQDHFDLVFHTSATPEGLQAGLDQLRPEGALIELSWYGQRPVSLDLGGSFHYGRKRIISSQVSHIAPAARPHWDARRRKELVFRFLEDPALDQYLGRAIPFEQSADFFNELRQSPLPDINAHLDYGQPPLPVQE